MSLFRPLLCLAAPALSVLAITAPAHADVKAGVDAWQKGDYKSAVAEWRPLAVAGDPDAQFNLGQAYKLGRGVPSDLAQAESWYRRAAQQGHMQAEDNLGLVLFTANKRDAAMPYITRSAERGEPRAQYVLGTAMFNGDLAPRNWPRAYALTKRASDAGLKIASERLVQLDSLIPLDQRQAGLAMLPDMERGEQRARLAAATAAIPPAPKPAKSPVRSAELPPSDPGTRYVPPPLIKPDAPVPASTGAPGTSYEAPEGLEELPPTRTISAPAAAPIKVAAVPPSATTPTTPAPERAAPKPAAPRPVAVTADNWRAQLGAFGVEGSARNLWRTLEKKFPGFAARQPYLVKTGKLTKLQVGNFANRADATAFCAALLKGGQSCLVVDK